MALFPRAAAHRLTARSEDSIKRLFSAIAVDAIGEELANYTLILVNLFLR